MPKISVTERDLSWYSRQRGRGPATVYIPGIATFGPEDPVLCDSSNFANVFGTAPVNVENELSYNMASSFIKSGFTVLFHRFLLEGSSKASGEMTFEESNGSKIVFNAKYEGTFGNKIKVVLSGPKAGVAAMFVYLCSDEKGTNPVLVETNQVLFVASEKMNDKYYTNLDSQYVEIGDVTGDFSNVAFDKNSVVILKGGKDFTDGATSESLYKSLATSVATSGALDNLADPYQYDFDVIVSAGLSRYEMQAELVPTEPTPLDKALSALALNRGTAIYLVDGHPDWTYQTMYAYCGLFDSSYVSAYGPWGYAQLLSTGVTMLLPGSYPMIIAWAQSCAAGSPIWYAPAGVKRSTLGSFFKRTKYYVGKTVLDTWQNHDTVYPDSYSVNPIMKAKQYGYIVYGNSTLLHTRSDGATSMLQSFSVRVLANLIKSRAFDVSLYLQFDQLTSDLFNQFKSLMGTFMDQLKYQKGLYDYEIVLTNDVLTSADLNEKRLPVTIRISPNPAAEFFDITLEITQSGVEFTDETDETEIG